MKKLLVLGFIMLTLLTWVNIARAEEASLSVGDSVSTLMEKLKLEDLKQGMSYDFTEHKSCYTFTKDIYTFKNPKWLNIDIGYTSNDKFIVGTAVNLFKMSDLTTIPILDLFRLDIDAWGGWSRCQLGGGMADNNEWCCGAGFTILKLSK